MMKKRKTEWRVIIGRATGILVLLGGMLLAVGLCAKRARRPIYSVPSIFDPRSTPAESIYRLSHFVLAITGLIFLVRFYAVDLCRHQVPQEPCG